MIRNIFLDRDGVINEVVIRGSVVSSPRNKDEFRIRKDFEEFAKRASNTSLNFFVVSNQPDVARGFMKTESLVKFDAEIHKLLPIREFSYCIHDDADNCQCRKPKPGLINDIIGKFGLRKDESCIVGDSLKDMKAGLAAGITTIFLSTEYNRNQLSKADFTIVSLTDLFVKLTILADPE